MRIDNKRGVESNVRNLNRKFLILVLVTLVAAFLVACPKPTGDQVGPPEDQIAATVNGTPIMLQEVERAIKSQAQGQESKLSEMELAQARLQVLQQLIQQEVMFQKAQKEQTIPTDDEVKAELNKLKTSSGVSQEEFAKRLKAAGQTEESLMDNLKKDIATKKLVEKITGTIEPPTDADVSAFYNGNKAAFVKKRGVELAMIVVDPRDTGNGDTTTNEAEASQRLKEIAAQLQKDDFATVAREKSEDPSAIRGGDIGNVSEEDLKTRYPQLAAGFMNDKFRIGSVTDALPLEGRFIIFKLKDRFEKDEELTLESPNVKKQITESLVNNKKQLLAASYQSIAINEAKVVNFLAQKIVDSPNELSGARRVTPEKEGGDTEDKADSNSNTESNAVANSDAKSEDKKSEEKPAADTNSEKKESDDTKKDESK
jgi:hypothetical protein